jgi:pilus assembly protein CpaC
LLADTAVNLPPKPTALTLTVGKGDLLQFANDVQRVAVSEPKVADAIVVSPREVMVNAKSTGYATVVIWETGLEPARYDVRVIPDTFELDTLRYEVRRIAGESVNVTGNDQTLVLTGAVKSDQDSKRAQALASTHAKNVVNLLQTPPAPLPRQILLEVKFASVDRTKLQEFGINLFSNNPSNLGAATTQQFQFPRFTQLTDVARPSVNFADILNLFYYRGDLNIGATIRDLQQRDLLEMLAEPNLICLDGKTASFLAGGQFPYPIVQSTTTGGSVAPVITVQFKQYGVSLDFTPTVLPDGAIHLEVSPEVSSLDYANSVTLQGFQIPALTTRRTDTEVVLKEGESFAIAGLIDNRVTEVLSKLPGFGDIPVIGRLFRSTSTQKANTELLVVVTPHFVRPLAPGEKVPLPPMLESFLPSPAQEQAVKDAMKLKKDGQKPEFVGPRGHQDPKP